jgi:hypothetical protein
MSKKVLVSVSSVLALLALEDVSPEVRAIVGEALGHDGEAVTASAEAPQPAPAPQPAAPALLVSADKLAEFVNSDPRFTRRSRKAAADFFAVTEGDVQKTLDANSGRFTTRHSTRGLGLLIETRD